MVETKKVQFIDNTNVLGKSRDSIPTIKMAIKLKVGCFFAFLKKTRRVFFFANLNGNPPDLMKFPVISLWRSSEVNHLFTHKAVPTVKCCEIEPFTIYPIIIYDFLS